MKITGLSNVPNVLSSIGRILKKLGYGHSLTLCFLAYSVRFSLISLIPTPWWVLPVELFMQGPTYAMSYTTIVAYASAVTPPGTSATMQGLAAGMDDGFGEYIMCSTIVKPMCTLNIACVKYSEKVFGMKWH